MFYDHAGALRDIVQNHILQVLALENSGDLVPPVARACQGLGVTRVCVEASGLTHKTYMDLAAAAARGEFREDLFYRLNVVALTLPPLREREGDVELLAETFLARIATGYGLPVPALTPELRSALRGHPWPGNVRELRNAIERALVLSPRGTLRPEELIPAPVRTAKTGGAALPFPATLDVLVRAAALAMLELTGGNKSEAARRLGISRPRLQRLLDGESDD